MKFTFRRAALAAPAIYLLIAFALIGQRPGLQYDEALPAMPAVHLSHASGPPTYPHDPGTWLCAGERCLPLMNLRYVGAVKDLAYLPIWAVAGTSVEAFRLVGAIFGAIGVAGVAILLARFCGWREAAVGAGVLAIHPAYLLQTVFDSGLIAAWMLAFGLICFAIAAYASHGSATRAILLGAACGFAIWTRANFLWLLIAAAIACAPWLWRQRRHAPHFLLGAILGGLPFLVYQLLSRGGTLEALSMYSAPGSLLENLAARLRLLAETLLSDREHRVMWNQAPMPIWQIALVSALAIAALAVAARRPIGRPVVLTTLVLAAILLISRMSIGEHHLIALVPLLAIAAGIACRARFATPALIVYAALAFAWDARAILGLSDTGGAGHWSNASATLARELARRDDEIVFIDWGLHNQIYFHTRGALRAREIFGDETTSEIGEPWTTLVQPGRLFVTNGNSHRVFPAPTEGVRRALAGRTSARRIGIPQHDGSLYAEALFDAGR